MNPNERLLRELTAPVPYGNFTGPEDATSQVDEEIEEAPPAPDWHTWAGIAPGALCPCPDCCARYGPVEFEGVRWIRAPRNPEEIWFNAPEHPLDEE